MAEIQAAAQPRSTKPRAKKHAFRLDMTPMVDLAFLLLTFFMLTTTFSKPNVMQLTMPDGKGDPMAVGAKNAMTLLLDKNGQVHYFLGLNDPADKPALHTTNFAADGLRQVLLEQRRSHPGLMVLIKTTPEASYRDMVDALDEMTITGQEKYAVVDTAPADIALLHR
ncbi:biopolymer transporter ExbD [Hymenobacter sp. 15J16-1T3B]|uniref:ExbD/TolR family protein n=1 Tax=Hymenobacter sp. 15J16-1T3B TaxID=2886941 RepID=UPI001D125281|nr:biopolymer transporter ExbD [Hymenobacter sp. 15J16-1T3B]MCC3156377.1 biopolymer transporter ExbD [Hymenobacter sp. 15J16-1T3B]